MIFVCKYRKSLLTDVGQAVIKQMVYISQTKDFEIQVIECDKNHIHLLVSYAPKVSPLMIARCLKQKTTIWLWNNYESYLKKHFWKEHTFWSDGYFVCSTGDASTDTIAKYIANQG
jgi:putative transposase